MRIPVPERLRAKPVFLFMLALVIVQQVEKTNVTFSLLTALYTALFAWAFNVGGGLYYVAGAYVFFNGTISALLGICYKCFLGEPGQSNLVAPTRTLAAYCVGMAGMGLAAVFSRRFVPKKAILSAMIAGDSMKSAAIGCLVFGIGLQILTRGGDKVSSISSAVGQVNHFVQMSVILATTYEITASGGKRSSNWILWVSGTWIFFYGVLGFSKEGMFIPLVSWFIPAIVLGFNFSKKQLIVGAFALFYVFHYLVPFSQYGRLYRTESGTGTTAIAVELLAHPEATRQLYLDAQETENYEGGPHYFDTPQGLFDREEMLSADDSLIVWSDQGNFRGITPTIEAFENFVPHFIWKNKPIVEDGNNYFREMGLLPEDDTTTGIAFSPVGDGYHEAGWFGVGLLFPFVVFLLFLVGDSLCGDTRKSPWGLLLIALVSHVAPEGLISGAVYLLGFGSFAVIMTAMLAKYLMPIISNVLTGSERTRVRSTMQFRPVLRGARINPMLRETDGTPPNS